MKNKIIPKNINSVIFDFDGTLCFGRYYELLEKEALDVVGGLIFGRNSSQWADPWMKGDLTSCNIASYLSEHLSESKEEILSALLRGCSDMTFNSAVYDFAFQQRQAGRKTALVTANMDVFTEIVVPSHKLDTLFDVVLNTADHRTLDKSILWKKAFDVFGPDYSFASSLLVEDNPRIVALFESLGGCAYQYEKDSTFLAWLEDIGFAKEM